MEAGVNAEYIETIRVLVLLRVTCPPETAMDPPAEFVSQLAFKEFPKNHQRNQMYCFHYLRQ